MKHSVICVLLFVCILSMALPVFANSAEPPGIILLTNDLPENATLTLLSMDGVEVEFRRITHSQKAWEYQYRLWFPMELMNTEKLYLQVKTGDSGITIPLPEEALNQYKTVLTLDYSKGTLTLGQEPWRQPLLTFLRVALTLLTEGIVFYLFGFRSRRSWIVFLVVNLLTQGWLNIAVNSYSLSGYWLLSFILIEAVIFMAESIAIPLLVKECKDWQRLVYVLTANAVSLALGIVLIGQLPL